ncbi:MAG: hypothetical protein QN131_13950 [Armatimonadota bacterium]|nr:hypothetical protein [Armatimonadota bacterium]
MEHGRIGSLRLVPDAEGDRRLAVVRLEGGRAMAPVTLLEAAGRISRALREMGVTDVSFEVAPAATEE